MVMRIRPASATDDPSYGQLVQLLRTKCCVGRELECAFNPTPMTAYLV